MYNTLNQTNGEYMKKNLDQKNANRYITNNNKQVTSNKQEVTTNNLIYRFASEDDKRSIEEPKVVVGSTSSNRSAQKDFSFITEKYEQAAQILPREEIFSASFSVLGKSSPERRGMNIDIILEPGGKPFKYKVDMVSSRYAYELTNKIKHREAQWPIWNQIKDDLRERDCMWGKLRNRTSNTKIVPRKRIPYCVAGLSTENDCLYANMILGNTTIVKCQLDVVTDEKLSKLFVAKGTWINQEWDEGEYDVQI